MGVPVCGIFYRDRGLLTDDRGVHGLRLQESSEYGSPHLHIPARATHHGSGRISSSIYERIFGRQCENFQDFFNHVVDPEWLGRNDEEARALWQAQSGKANKAWRVLHRVTYIERPALMGFGRLPRVMTAAESTDYQVLVEKINGLEELIKALIAQK